MDAAAQAVRASRRAAGRHDAPRAEAASARALEVRVEPVCAALNPARGGFGGGVFVRSRVPLDPEQRSTALSGSAAASEPR